MDSLKRIASCDLELGLYSNNKDQIRPRRQGQQRVIGTKYGGSKLPSYTLSFRVIGCMDLVKDLTIGHIVTLAQKQCKYNK